MIPRMVFRPRRAPSLPRPKLPRIPAAAWRWLALGLAGIVIFGAVTLAAAWGFACAGDACPSLDGLGEYDPEQASKVYAADGRLVTDLGLERRTVVPLKEMSPAVVEAFLATEDKRFYEHDGIDWVRVVGAAKGIALGGRLAGASTITMQLAGNLFPEEINRRERSVRRKIREAKVATRIEARYPKDKILELYLNQIDLGNRAFGVEAAAQRYFGKSVRELNVAEAATLAGMPQAPSRYNPRRNPTLAVQRRNVVLTLLRDNGLLTRDELERWKGYPLRLSSRSDYSGHAEYFVEYLRQQLEARFGTGLYRRGLRIYTTLDLDMQLAAERALETQLQAIEGGKYGKFPHRTYAEVQDRRADDEGEGARTPYLQGLLVTMDARTGHVRALVGGRDFTDSKFNRATQALRQPGSTFKPLVVAAAVEAGFPMSRIVVDDSFAFEAVPGEPLWEPKNYDLKYLGPMTMRRALFESRNIPLIRLGIEVGMDNVVAMARRCGLSGDIKPFPSIAIGAADVIPLEMISCFTTFASDGERALPQVVLRVEDAAGRILWQPQPRRERVMEPAPAWLVTDALRDVVRRGTAAGAVGAQTGFPSGGKTGTTNDGFDVWYIGFTRDLVTGIWMGFDQPQKIMANAQGGRLAAPAWAAYMREVYERRPPPGEFPRPEGLVAAEIDDRTGGLATPLCPKEVRFIESYLPGTEPTEYCPAHGGQMFGAPGPVQSPLTGSTEVPTLRPPTAPPVPAPDRTPAGVMGGVGPPPRSNRPR